MSLRGTIIIEKPKPDFKIGLTLVGNCKVTKIAGLSAKRGLRVGDTILEVCGEAVTNTSACISKLKSNQSLQLTVER